jgi:hypothetical protein
MTPEQIALLTKPFKPSEHGFLNGSPYVLKSAIRRRLAEVDPTWSLGQPLHLTTENDVVVMSGSLMVCGITRHEIGTGIITRTKKDKSTGEYIDLPAYEIARNVAKAFKTAASDILPRAAVQFGVGQYLKDITPNERGQINTPDALAAWLKRYHTPAHWSLTPDGQPSAQGLQIAEHIKSRGLSTTAVLAYVESGRTLKRISDTTLTYEQFCNRLLDLAADAPTPEPPASDETGAVMSSTSITENHSAVLTTIQRGTAAYTDKARRRFQTEVWTTNIENLNFTDNDRHRLAEAGYNILGTGITNANINVRLNGSPRTSLKIAAVQAPSGVWYRYVKGQHMMPGMAVILNGELVQVERLIAESSQDSSGISRQAYNSKYATPVGYIYHTHTYLVPEQLSAESAATA